jgi:glycosyltransferase involved in cell wall biosynthesis
MLTQSRRPHHDGKMHVVHIVPTLAGGGAETLVRSIVPRLVAGDMRLSVISVYPAEIGERERELLGAPLFEMHRNGAADGVRAFRETVNLLRELQPDVVHGHVHTGKYFGRAAALIARVPHVLYTEHHPRPEHSVAQWLADEAMRDRTDAVIAFHDRQRDEIARRDAFPFERIAVVPNGIEHAAPAGEDARLRAREALGISPGTFVVLFAGRLAEQKFPELAIDAFAELPPSLQRRDLLLIAGDGPLAASLAQRCVRLGSNVRLLGYRRDMADLYAVADAFLMTSRYEAMPLAPIEAMSQGMPVVTTPWEGAEEIVRDRQGGFVTSSFDHRELAAALTLLRDFPECSRTLSERAAERARSTYDIGRTVQGHRDLYNTLVGGHA